jgi:multicomponent Na+:H+ antiporter subunit G
VIGLLPLAHGVLGGLKLVVVWMLVQLSGATVGQLIAQSIRRNGPTA